MTKILKWQTELRERITDPKQLVEFGVIKERDLPKFEIIYKQFPFAITQHYANLINWDDPDDPLLKMVTPTLLEVDRSGLLDQSGESVHTKEDGVQVKYPSTALVLAIPACFSYCRFCFRKRLFDPGQKGEEIAKNLNSVIEYLKNHKRINNVLITGGDPLMIPTPQLRKFLTEIREIDNIKIIRIGTRALSYLPSRINSDPDLLDLFSEISQYDKRVYIINHFDHPRELTKDTGIAANKLIAAGVILANQSVILKGVNDSPVVLRELFNKLAAWGITPYYYFQTRFVQGATHFQVPLYKSCEIFNEAKKDLNGLAKRAKHIMAHFTGKIEILGVQIEDGERKIYLKYHHAPKDSLNGKIFSFPLSEDAYWLDDIPEAKFLYEQGE